MIISASRRTDIPAFYSDWFMGRIREGFFHRVNPFNSNQVSAFSLKPEHLDAICFWTKNPRPLMQHLDELDSQGYNYYFQFTLNPYGKLFEPNVPALMDRIATFREFHVISGRLTVSTNLWKLLANSGPKLIFPLVISVEVLVIPMIIQMKGNIEKKDAVPIKPYRSI